MRVAVRIALLAGLALLIALLMREAWHLIVLWGIVVGT